MALNKETLKSQRDIRVRRKAQFANVSGLLKDLSSKFGENSFIATHFDSSAKIVK
jgi:hypothetical protein